MAVACFLCVVICSVLIIGMTSKREEDGAKPSLGDINAMREQEEELRQLIQRLTKELADEKKANAQMSQLLERARSPSSRKHDHRLAILVPFRNAHQELQRFVPHMSQFLERQNIDFTIFIINQLDRYRFNRGALLDVGFMLAEQEHDYIAMHDVDLLPLNPQLNYSFAPQPRHLAAPWLHPIYHYANFIGGIMLMSSQHFRMLNGLSSNFWGWGREDDEFYKRIVEFGLHLERPGNLSTGTVGTFRHLHDQEQRVRDMMKVGGQYAAGLGRDRVSGLNTTEHVVQSVHKEEAEGYPYIMVDVQLVCDEVETPWCLPPTKCNPGYYRHQPSNVCRRCAKNCWLGFVLVGNCTEQSNTQCLKVGRDISVEEAAGHLHGNVPLPRH